MDFLSIFNRYSWEDIASRVEAVTSKEVEQSLSKKKLAAIDFLHLISKAAVPYLEDLAQRSRAITLKRFGSVMQLYVPMYLSNECANVCTYCGFSLDNKTPRVTLTPQQIKQEAQELKARGFAHILLLTGEAPGRVGLTYFRKTLAIMQEYFSHISLEVQPLDTEEYRELAGMGLDGVVVYQESYRQSTYRTYHPRGKKSQFNYRIETPDRLGRAGIKKIGLGVLLGLENWRVESFFAALHLNYLKRKYWKSKYSISFPRLRPAQGVLPPKNPISDRELVQLITAWRLLDEDLELHLSTRESSLFRDQVCSLGITSMSAGSKTSPGGYSCFAEKEELEQFEISDHRDLRTIKEMLRSKGFHPITKDWDRAFSP